MEAHRGRVVAARGPTAPRAPRPTWSGQSKCLWDELAPSRRPDFAAKQRLCRGDGGSRATLCAHATRHTRPYLRRRPHRCGPSHVMREDVDGVTQDVVTRIPDGERAKLSVHHTLRSNSHLLERTCAFLRRHNRPYGFIRADQNSDRRRQGARANGRLRDIPTSWAGAGVLLPSFSRPAAS